MFSGYIPVDGTDRELFYWFVESDHGMGNRPVLLWTNGGPGCSGFLGLLTEQGPFRPSAHGWLLPNDFAWTRYASVVFIEQPVGVGFSRSGKMAETYSDGNAASDNYRFVVNFFERFRELKKNEFYITSESYGGHYMPMLAKQIVDRGGVPQFRGFMVGNPLTSGPLRDFGEFATFAGHQLLPKSLTTQYFKDHSCRDEPGSFACTRLMMEARSIVAGLDPYGLDFPKCNAHVMAEKVAFLKVLGLIDASVQPRAVKDSGDGDQAVARRSMQYFPNKYLPCEEGYATKWLNRKDVQAALHVRPGKAPWAGCNDFINMAWNRTDTVVSMVCVLCVACFCARVCARARAWVLTWLSRHTKRRPYYHCALRSANARANNDGAQTWRPSSPRSRFGFTLATTTRCAPRPGIRSGSGSSPPPAAGCRGTSTARWQAG